MIVSFNRFELNITKKDAQTMSHQGDCENDCKALVPKYRKQLNKITFDKIVDELVEYGAWTKEELEEDMDMTYIRLLWIASGNLLEEAKE